MTAQVSFSVRDGRLVSAARGSPFQLADVTAVARKFFGANVAYAAGDEEGCAACTKLYWTAVTASAVAGVAVAAEMAASVACLAGTVPACLELPVLHEATVAALAVAATAWALYNARKAAGGGGETMVVPAGGAASRLPAGSSPTIQRAEVCEDPEGGGGGGGGGGTTCWTEHWTVEISYDSGTTWETLWEGDVEVCDYAT